MPGPSPSDIAYGLGALWIANESSSSVTRLDPASGGLQELPVGNGPEAVAVGYGSVWVANSLDGTVSRIDPNSNVVTSLHGRAGPVVGARERRRDLGRRQLRRPDRSHRPRDERTVVRTIAVGSGPQSLAAIGGRIWLSARETAAVHRGGTLRLFDWIDAPDSLDAAGGYGSAWSVFSVSGDGLVGLQARGRPGRRHAGSRPRNVAARYPRTAAARTRSSCGAASATRTATRCVRATCGARSSAPSALARR